VSTRSETTMLRPAITVWARAALALLAFGGIAALASIPPSLPAMPWQPLQPTVDELVRQTIVCVAWLLLAAICVRVAWLAAKPPRRAETTTHVQPRWLPDRRRPLRPPQHADTRVLLNLFSRPRTVDRSDPARAAATLVRERPEVVNCDAEATDKHAEEELTVRLLGHLSIGNGDGTGLSERATRGLIAYLVLKRAPVTMDELVEALWPGEAPTRARQRLWKAKRQAQRLLGDLLVRRQDSYTIDRSRLRTDIDELDKLRMAEPLDADALERASRLTLAEPLADVDYLWADGERRRLQAIQAELLEQLAGARVEGGDANGALAVAERLIELDGLNERGWCLAMEAEGALGNRQAILDRYERLGRELNDRLGLKPSREAKETYRRLLSQA
jgi:DNA-binding SARP family transcriptional activator